jgi:hypothetical protein
MPTAHVIKLVTNKDPVKAIVDREINLYHAL